MEIFLFYTFGTRRRIHTNIHTYNTHMYTYVNTIIRCYISRGGRNGMEGKINETQTDRKEGFYYVLHVQGDVKVHINIYKY